MRATALIVSLTAVIIGLLFWAGVFVYEVWLQVQTNTRHIAVLRLEVRPLVINKYGTIYINGEEMETP